MQDADSLSSSVADAVHTLLAEFSLNKALLAADEEGEKVRKRRLPFQCVLMFAVLL